MSSAYERLQQRKKNNATKVSDEKNLTAYERLQKRKKKTALESTINFDTFESDLNAMGKTLQTIGSEWQTPETMKNTRATVEAMHSRINAYNEYQKMFGGADLTDMANTYTSILENWDDQAAIYGRFKNAEAFNTEKKNIKLAEKFRVATGRDHAKGETTYRGMTFDEVQAAMKKYSPDSDEYKFLSTYTGYTDLEDFDKAINNNWYKAAEKTYNEWKIPQVGKLNEKATKETGVITYYNQKDVEEATKARDEYMKKTLGGKSWEDVKNSYDASWISELETKRNQWAADNKFDLYDHYMESEDFGEKSQYWDGHSIPFDDMQAAIGSAVSYGAKSVVYDKESETYYVYTDPLYEYVNDQNNARNNLTKGVIYGKLLGAEYSNKGYDMLTEDEIRVFNAIDEAEGPEAAEAYLKDMSPMLTKRKYDKQTQQLEKAVDSNPWAAAGLSALSVPANLVGGLGNIFATADEFIKGEEFNPYHRARMVGNQASDIRKYTGENITEATEGMELFGQNVPAFLYNTGMSMGDSALGVLTTGKAYTVLAGSTAFQQKAKEMYEAGESQETIYATAMGSGLAEMVFEYIGIDNLIKIKDIDSLKRMVVAALKQGGIEGLEEGGTELANIFIDTDFRGETSELARQYDELKRRGFSEGEITLELAKQYGSQVGWAIAGGALSGIGMGAAPSAISYGQASAVGKGIRNSEQVGNMIEIAGLTPQESAAYKAYTEYVNKGINADNITKAQLGNLYNTAKSGAHETLNSKKSSIDEKGRAIQTLNSLREIDTETAIKKRAEKLVTNKSGESANIEGIKIGDGTTVVTPNGEVSVEKANLNERDAELVARAEGIATEYGEDIASLFIAQDDGKTDVLDYANSFNLAMLYAKNNFAQDLILENKGVLSNEQVSAIYEATVKATAEAQQNAIKTITEKQGKTMTIQGKFDDSIIDYDSKTTDGSKVNWDSLTSTQRKAVRFVQLFSKATGVNVTFIKSEVVDGVHKGENGRYDPKDNTIYIDVYAGRIDAKHLNDSIIPTLSHEMTHWMKAKAPALYESIRNDVLGVLSKEGVTNSARVLNEMERIRIRDKKKGIDREVTPEEAIDEIVARACEDMLSNSKKARELLSKMSETEQQTFIDKIKETFENLMQWIDDLLSYYKSGSKEAKFLREYKEDLAKISEQWDAMLTSAIEANQALQSEGITGEKLARKVSKAQKNTTNGDVKNADRITENMSEEERYEILKNRKITLADINKDEYDKVVSEHPQLLDKKLKTTDAKKLLRKIGTEFGVFDKYNNTDVEVEFEFGKNNLDESVNKQKGNYDVYAQMLSCFSDIITNAVGIEVHNRNKEGYKTDRTLKNVYVLCSAFENDVDVVPVKLEIKEFIDKPNRLYVAVALEGIKKDRVVSMGVPNNRSHVRTSPVTISIRDLFSKINPKDADFLKYIPNGFLNDEQIASKRVERGDIRYSDRDTQINQSMTMDEAKQMIQRAFVLGGIQEWYDNEYKNGDEWLRGVGADEVALNIENEYTLTEKYLNKLQDYIDGEFYVEDILNAYLNGTLTGKEKAKAKRLDISKDYRVNDKRFYSPKRIKDVKKLLSIASQRVTDKTRAEISNARAKILLFAHNEGASELLGLTQTELNKKLRTWSGYPAGAMETSKKFNKGVADSNKWTGIENCSWLYRSTITTEELESLVKEIKGAANDYEKLYIARTMLALDTHIDWSWLTFEFDTNANVNKKQVGSGRCNGFYRNDARLIVVSHNMPHTVAHEMGHALDYQWARDLGFSHSALTEVSRNTERITDAETKQFFDNFRIFIDSLTDNSDIRSEYTQDPKEVFARFVAQFIQWVDNTGTGNHSYRVETSYYNDKFTASNYIEFVRLLQEKAMLDAKRMETETSENVQFADRDTTYMDAVNRGDMETAQRMVDKAAKEAGYVTNGYHGTKSKGFTVFEKGDIGFHFGTKEQAKTKAGHITPSKSANPFFLDEENEIKIGTIINAFLKMDNSLIFERDLGEWQVPEIVNYFEALLNNDKTFSVGKFNRQTKEVTWEKVDPKSISNIKITESDRVKLDAIKNQYERDWNSNKGKDEKDFVYSSRSAQMLREFLQEKGYDSIKYLNEYEGEENAYSYMVFYPEQIKSADPVTYDDNGNVIPLSQRFNKENDDIRYADRFPDYNWHTGMSDAEVSYIERIAKHEVESTENYIDAGNKWLYNDRKRQPYFALYSTAHIDNPTVMYASKGKQAEVEHQFLIDYFAEKVNDDERIIIRTEIIDTLLENYGYGGNKSNVRSGNSVGRGSNKGNVRVYSQNSRNRPSEAFLNCLRNIAETQERENGVKQFADRDIVEDTTVAFNGKDFWIAMVNRRTGKIEKTWTYEEANSEGFDLERYTDVLEEDGYVFFTTDLLQDNDRIEYDDYGDVLPEDLADKINEQIEVVHPNKNSVSPKANDIEKQKADADSLYREFLKELGASNEDVANASFEEYVNGTGENTAGPIASLFMYIDEEVEYRAEKYVEEGLEESEAYEKAINETKQLGEIVGKLSKYLNAKTDRVTIYSDRMDESVYDKMGETKRLETENAKLKADIERLKERLSIEKKVTHGNYFNRNQLDAVAGHIRKIAGSTYSKTELVKLLDEVYSYIATSENLNWDDLYAQCCDVARSVLEESKPVTETNDYAKQVLNEIRSAKFWVNEGQKNEAKYTFGNKWHQVFFGKTNITNDLSRMSLEQVWKVWAETYPDIFDATISDADMLVELNNIYARMKDASEVVVDYYEEDRIRWLAKEIYNQYWNVSTVKTTADKYDKQIKRLNFEHRKAMAEFRNDYEERLAEQKKTERERTNRLVERIRERKDKEIAEAKQLGKERLDKYKENAERKTKIQSITSNALTLNKWLIKNSKDEHIHESLKGPVIALLQAIDFSSQRMLDKNTPTRKDISLQQALSKVKDMMADASVGKEELVSLYGHDMDEDIKTLVESVDNIMRTVGDNEFVLNQMSLEDLQTLDKLVKTIKHSVTAMNRFHAVNHARGIANLSQESMEHLDSLGKENVYKGLRGAVKKLVNWNNALPFYTFKRYGKGGEKVFEAFQDGWDKFAFHIKKIIDFSNSVYDAKDVKEWSKDIKSFKILEPATEEERQDPNYKPKHQTVQMSVPQIMSLYCLWKREQARGHILGGGVRIADIEQKSKVISQSEGINLTFEDITNIIGTLSNKQIEVADKLQEFMNTVCSDWGNEVSMLRFGYKAFGEENYFPIQSDKNNLATEDETEKSNSLFRLLNMSFTKALTEKANNRIVISDIFDVFAQHSSDMAKYNALALPVLDAFKWYNYKEKVMKGDTVFKTNSVKQSIETAFGKDGQNYFTTFLRDLNGDKEVSRDNLGGHFFTNAKIAAVGLNLRVVFLQPTSYVRASAIIDPQYLSAALLHKPKMAKAKEHCGMVLWKSMGYYDTDVQRGVAEQIKHDTTFRDKAAEVSMWGAGKADELTLGYLWNACELEVRRTRKDLKVGSDEFNRAIAKRLREVIYSTQVVDSTMTRSQMMRGSNMYEKMLTAFSSEPTLAFNMLQDAYMEMRLDGRTQGKKIAFKNHGKKLARVVTAYTLTNIAAAIVESGFDAFRDDDDEEMDLEEFMRLFLTNFASDMSLTAKIPYIKEMQSIIKGFGTSRTDTQWMESIANTLKGWIKIFSGEGNPEKALKNSLRTISDVSGLPFFNVYRDLMAALNKLNILTAEDLEELFDDFF